MKTTGRSLAGASLLLALGVTASHAHDGMHGPGAEYDQDEDGALSLAEYTTYLKESKQDTSRAKARFAALDANKDGELSSAEFIKGLIGRKSG